MLFLYMNTVLLSLWNASVLADLQRQVHRLSNNAVASCGGRRATGSYKSSSRAQRGNLVFDGFLAFSRGVNKTPSALNLLSDGRRKNLVRSSSGLFDRLSMRATPHAGSARATPAFAAAAPGLACWRSPGNDNAASCGYFRAFPQKPAACVVLSQRPGEFSEVSSPSGPLSHRFSSSWSSLPRRLFSHSSRLAWSKPPPLYCSSLCTSWSNSNLSSPRLFSRFSYRTLLSSRGPLGQARPPFRPNAPLCPFPLNKCRPHSSMIFSLPLPTESHVKNVEPAPTSLCLMMKWFLEKVGADSSSLSCFLPAEIPRQGRASPQSQQQQHEELSDTHKSLRHSSSNTTNEPSSTASQASMEKTANVGRAKHDHVAPTKEKRDFYEGWIEAKLCFGSFPSKALRDAFRKTYDERLLRWGRLLELLDCFAGDIAYHYCTPDEEGYAKMNTLMVTASIQRMEFVGNVEESPGQSSSSSSDMNSGTDGSSGVPTNAYGCSTVGKTGQVVADLNVEEDLWVIGYVTQSGDSSMGIRIEIQQGGRVKGSVFFVMVAVTPEGRPAKIVPELDTGSCSPELQKLIRACAADFSARKALAKKILSLVPPDPEESLFLHETWKKSLARDSQVVWMKDTRLQSIELIQPESLTRYNRAFGGLVARKALQLSYLTAQCFLRVLRPCLRGVDDMFFLEPLYVGDMLLMVATVVWSTPEEIQIQVEAFREDPLSGGRQRTNLFNFRYDTVARDNNGLRVCIAPPIYPQDYKDCISFLEARRRYLMRREGPSRLQEKWVFVQNSDTSPNPKSVLRSRPT